MRRIAPFLTVLALVMAGCSGSPDGTGGTLSQSDIDDYLGSGDERPVSDFTIGGMDGSYDGPLDADSGGVLRGRICVEGGVAGMEWFVTLGEPPGAPEATHFSGTLDADGCMDFELPVNWPAGTTTKLYTSDGENVVEVDIIHVG